MMARVNKAHFPVTTLGPGRRIGIWFQGCTIGCPGCISLDTWAVNAGTAVSVAALLEWSEAVAPGGFDGVTISGGEPFQQPEALAALLDGFSAMRAGRQSFDLLCYSGYPLKALERRFSSLLCRLDAIVSGPYRADQAPGAYLRGSRNQQVVPLSALGRARYKDLGADQMCVPGAPNIQVNVDDRGIWYIGIPRPGDLERLEAAARLRGIEMEGASWRA